MLTQKLSLLNPVEKSLYEKELIEFKDFDTSPKSENGALFNYNKLHRYFLWRRWDRACAVLAFVGINPSTANGETDDPTTRRCISYAKTKGYGGICMVNLFTVISKDPKFLTVLQPNLLNTPNSDFWIDWVAKKYIDTVFMWGNEGSNFIERVTEIKRIFSQTRNKPLCLGTTKKNNPKHILYLPKDTKLQIYS